MLWVKVLFWPKNANFCKNMVVSAKLRGAWNQKVCFLKLHMCMYLRAKFEISRLILTSFDRRKGSFPPTPYPQPPPQNESQKNPPRLGYKNGIGKQSCAEKATAPQTLPLKLSKIKHTSYTLILHTKFYSFIFDFCFLHWSVIFWLFHIFFI